MLVITPGHPHKGAAGRYNVERWGGSIVLLSLLVNLLRESSRRLRVGIIGHCFRHKRQVLDMFASFGGQLPILWVWERLPVPLQCN